MEKNEKIEFSKPEVSKNQIQEFEGRKIELSEKMIQLSINVKIPQNYAT